ncbi:MAG: InlB B-repeat-containing protein, partial [Clostridia bacterium]|nr:InlB B-repeat-containing protein [Clostridia bacterium]
NKPGYTFAGWYYDEALTKPYDINTVIEKGTEPFTLYAKWTKN